MEIFAEMAIALNCRPGDRRYAPTGPNLMEQFCRLTNPCAQLVLCFPAAML